jgi:alcohol dehydrogenase
MACGDAKALAQVALLDPELTASQPKLVASLTGLDALAHAVETAVCIPRNPISNIHSLEAFRLLARSIHSVITGTALPEDRSNMLLGAALAGLAIENSMLGAAHACANPLTAFFDVTHGHAVSLMLPYVIRFNRLDPEVDEIYRSYESFIPASGAEKNDMADWLEALKETAGLKSLSEMRIGLADVKRLAKGASQQWTGRFNPRPLGLLDLEAIYSSAISDVVGSV